MTEALVTKSSELTQIEMEKLDNLLKNDKYDFRNVLQLITRITILLHRTGCLTNQKYTQDKEDELEFKVSEIKGSYNSKKVLTVQIISGALTIAGGLLAVFGVVPALASSAKLISGIGTAATAGGQGTGVFGKLCDTDDESKRQIHQTAMSRIQKKHDDRNKAQSEDSQMAKEAQRTLDRLESEYHQALSRLSSAGSAA